ncbi:ABC transporter ATP-binding protein [bacterium]|nr:ABC transporter ATP-binding protein [bacterium]
MSTAVNIENIGKRYIIGHQRASGTLRDAVTDAFHRIISSRKKGSMLPASKEEFWALKDVSFDIEQGDRVAIIGRNGAGKSTLLKVISRITEPTTGRIGINGRVASLLEVGTGFHPELTGRENIYLNGAILGMTKSEINRKYDEIVAFSEIEKFIDTPVKRYSSGMYVRLAFAVAAHLEPEILVIDEVLAVGDAQFQKKCLGKMGDVSREGRTILFVSHNMTAVQTLCNRAVWLDGGAVRTIGEAGTVASKYLQTSVSSVAKQVWDDMSGAPGNDKVRIRSVSVRPESSDSDCSLVINKPIILEFEYWNNQPGAYLNLSLHIYNEDGIIVFNTLPEDEPNWHGKPFPRGLFRSTCIIPADLLNDGMHRVEALVVQDQCNVIYKAQDVLVFDVGDDISRRGSWHGKFPGAVRPRMEWHTDLIESANLDVDQLREPQIDVA